MIGITTIPKPIEQNIAQAREIAEKFSIPFFERKESCKKCMEENNLDGLIVCGKELFLKTKDGEYKFHLGMAKLRLLQLKRGNVDRLCKLIPESVSTFLDCTFGQGNDSIVVSGFLGEKSKIISLEKSKALYIIGKYGIKKISETDEYQDILKRIELKNEDFFTYLKKAESKSIDVVYFDTMFKHPVKSEKNHREAFRKCACYDKLTKEILDESIRVAKKRVIIKERPFSIIFRKYNFSYIDTKKGQSVAYGVIET